MKIDWKELLIVGIPSVIAGGSASWYAQKRGANAPIIVFTGIGAGAITMQVVQFIKRRVIGTPEQLPDAKMDSLPSGEVPVATPTADAALGKVAAREKAVEPASPNVKPTNPQEVGDNVVDLKPGGGIDLGAFGSTGSE